MTYEIFEDNKSDDEEEKEEYLEFRQSYERKHRTHRSAKRRFILVSSPRSLFSSHFPIPVKKNFPKLLAFYFSNKNFLASFISRFSFIVIIFFPWAFLIFGLLVGPNKLGVLRKII